MTQSRLRMMIFGAWLSFWIISTLLLVMSRWWRADGAINADAIMPAILSITGIWLPALSLLAAFWFPPDEQNKSQNVVVSGERTLAAVALTVIYLVFVLFLIVWSTYIVTYDTNVENLPESSSFAARLDQSVKLALLISPIALAPINWLTGGTARTEQNSSAA